MLSLCIQCYSVNILLLLSQGLVKRQIDEQEAIWELLTTAVSHCERLSTLTNVSTKYARMVSAIDTSQSMLT